MNSKTLYRIIEVIVVLLLVTVISLLLYMKYYEGHDPNMWVVWCIIVPYAAAKLYQVKSFLNNK